jgi:hypothetical protein
MPTTLPETVAEENQNWNQPIVVLLYLVVAAQRLIEIRQSRPGQEKDLARPPV